MEKIKKEQQEQHKRMKGKNDWRILQHAYWLYKVIHWEMCKYLVGDTELFLNNLYYIISLLLLTPQLNLFVLLIYQLIIS